MDVTEKARRRYAIDANALASAMLTVAHDVSGDELPDRIAVRTIENLNNESIRIVLEFENNQLIAFDIAQHGDVQVSRATQSHRPLSKWDRLASWFTPCLPRDRWQHDTQWNDWSNVGNDMAHSIRLWDAGK